VPGERQQSPGGAGCQVAATFKDRAIGVVLTGGDCDGSEGVRAIKQAGGTVIAQEEAPCEDPSMPRAAVATGCVDRILALGDIAPALVGLVEAC
jgi:two-component system chemotaxis response regulator CheB